ncbi:MAG TPA: glycosyltransferase [Thermoanaerobaculia bacterium]|nr:glycosyltransferase [Thermoanaerobaculia bacterium]
MSGAPHLILVVPCYNEEQRLPVDAFRNFAVPGARIEFCFVNDGSRDGTLRLLQSLAAEDPSRYSVLNLEKNSGKAEAVRRGILEAMARKPDLTGFWDADLATPLTELPALLGIFAARPEIEMVFAARVRLLGREISRNPMRHYFGRLGATLISQTLGLAVYDTQCGAKLFRVSEPLRVLFDKPFLSRWIFDVEIIARLVEQRGRNAAAGVIYELPIKVWHDVKGSKVTSGDFAKALKDLARIRRAYKLH